MKKSPLAILTGAALSLPAFSATQPTETTIAVKASRYEEDRLSSTDVVAGSRERYDIDVYQFQLTAPVKRDWSVGVDVSREIMSGASPWGTIPAFSGSGAALIMSGATIADNRTEVALTASRYFDKSSTSVTLSHSDEDDYTAKAITIGTEWDLRDGMSTLAVGASYSSDDIEPSDAQLFGRVLEEEKRSRSLTVAWTQILNRTSVLQVGASLTKRDGFLSDPYKLRDVRPDERFEKTFSLRYRRYLEAPDASLHLNYRYFHDDFGIRSHTLDASWHQPVGEYLRLVPTVRYYSQEEADFYRPFDSFLEPPGQPQSSDFRLSSYGAWSLGVKAIISLDRWAIDIAAERYIADGDYGLDDPEFDHPALLEFNLVTFGLSYRF